MNSGCVNIFKRFYLLTAFIVMFAGCGSESSPANNGTGSLAARLVWNETSAKSLYKAPDGVDYIQIVVLNSNSVSLASQTFAASLGGATIDGIPAGSGYTVRVKGLGSGYLLYERVVSNVTITVGAVTDLGAVRMYSVTTATPSGGSYDSPQSVTLTNNESTTIYYTTSATDGADPTISSPVYGNTPISISGNIFLKFFAVYPGNITETVRREMYSTP